MRSLSDALMTSKTGHTDNTAANTSEPLYFLHALVDINKLSYFNHFLNLSSDLCCQELPEPTFRCVNKR